MRLIGIASVGQDKLAGSVIVGLVDVDPNYFRTVTALPLKRFKHLPENKRAMLFKKTCNHTFFQIRYIRAEDITDDNLDELECKAIIELLNTVPKFWKEKIFINFSGGKDRFLELLSKHTPQNLIKEDLRLDSWHVSWGASDKFRVAGMAYMFAKHYEDIELNGLKDIWKYNESDPGQFILDNPTCPWIRKNTAKVKNLLAHTKFSDATLILNKLKGDLNERT